MLESGTRRAPLSGVSVPVSEPLRKVHLFMVERPKERSVVGGPLGADAGWAFT